MTSHLPELLSVFIINTKVISSELIPVDKSDCIVSDILFDDKYWVSIGIY